jgi:FAD/FMN-containing dehydrogenase
MFCKQQLSLLMVLSTRLTSVNTLASFGKFALLGVYAQAVYDEVSHHLYSHRAIRGGGPGTWGVVTSITYKAHPAVPFAWVSIASNATSIDDNYELVQRFIENAPYWADLGGGALISIFPKSITFLGIIPNATKEELKRHLPTLPAGSSVNYTEEKSFLSFLKETLDIADEM